MRKPWHHEGSPTGASVSVMPDAESLALAAAAAIAAEARRALRRSGRFTIALSGGSTPEPAYRLLAGPPFSDLVPWEATHIFFSDERCVNPDDPRSNEGMARRALLDRVPIPSGQVHPIHRPRDHRATSAVTDPGTRARADADAYEDLLRAPAAVAEGGRFDLVLLGLGADGHTASLFPGSEVLDERVRWVAAVSPPDASAEGADAADGVDAAGSRTAAGAASAGGTDKPPWRVTLTATSINLAGLVLFLVSGAAKAAAVKEVIQGSADPRRVPARLIRPAAGRLCWLVDEEAAGELDLADNPGLGPGSPTAVGQVPTSSTCDQGAE